MVPAAPESIGALRRELRRWARRRGAPAAVQANLALAFSEACTSIIGVDAPPEGLPGPLMLEARDDGDQLVVEVSHPSRGVPSPPVGVGYGFGLALIARLCDQFEVRRREQRPGTSVLMAFRLVPAREPARSSPPRLSRSSTRR
jgi:anti-sigma regulatory factor (Ser/Thr protein kinase)